MDFCVLVYYNRNSDGIFINQAIICCKQSLNILFNKRDQNDCCIDSAGKPCLICVTGLASIAFGYPNADWENPKPLQNYDEKRIKKDKKEAS